MQDPLLQSSSPPQSHPPQSLGQKSQQLIIDSMDSPPPPAFSAVPHSQHVLDTATSIPPHTPLGTFQGYPLLLREPWASRVTVSLSPFPLAQPSPTGPFPAAVGNESRVPTWHCPSGPRSGLPGHSPRAAKKPHNQDK